MSHQCPGGEVSRHVTQGSVLSGSFNSASLDLAPTAPAKWSVTGGTTFPVRRVGSIYCGNMLGTIRGPAAGANNKGQGHHHNTFGGSSSQV